VTKPPPRTVTAVRLVLIVVVAALLMGFAAIGVLWMTRDTPAKVVHAFGETSGPPAVGTRVFSQTVSLFTGTPLRAGHHIEILNDGEGTFPRLWRDLRGARRSITVQIYYAKPGRLADELADALMDRARAGVTVHFLYDGFGATPLTGGYLDSLRTAGVRVAVFRPVKWYALHKAQNRSHVRAVVVDGRIGYTGGFGIADQWLGDGRSLGEWREINVRFVGPAVQQLQAAFATAWTEATGELLVGGLYFEGGAGIPVDAAGDTAYGPTTADVVAGRPEAGDATVAGLVYAAPTIGSTVGERLLALSMAGARRTLYIANAYLVPSDFLHGQLALAVARGVDVRLLLPGERVDVRTTRLAARSEYERLLRAGVRIYEYQPTMMHAKTFVIDGVWSAIGTMNLDNRSLAFNDESILVALDGSIGATMDSLFHDDLTRSVEIRLEVFRRRSWWTKLVERAAGLLENLL